jgi:hypothetical protein
VGAPLRNQGGSVEGERERRGARGGAGNGRHGAAMEAGPGRLGRPDVDDGPDKWAPPVSRCV